MIRCDNDECILSRECWRFLIAPQDADGVNRFEPQPTQDYNRLMAMMELPQDARDRIAVECDYYIVLADYPENVN